MTTDRPKTEAPVRFLEGKRIYLRPINSEDADFYYQMLFNPEMRRLTGTQRHFSKEQVASHIEGKTQSASDMLLLIAIRESDQIIGDIELQDIDSINRSAGMRIAIDAPANQGRGFGSEAIGLLLEYAFGILQLHRIELNVFAFNERAIHVYEKMGFRREGVQRDALYYNHAYHDSIIMSILEHEYRNRA
ncbi:GNAT family N-acetyltransferase [Paenibacillus thiaminolyticus]|uniref:GNAT family N-acetyltransferase n=1 Tax=Paenibacillus thiaminolyticus TaxID=49283 RepID=UPI00232D31C4|nr:GNAT family protein [Paenibacillus thiaminolyticus]WCF08223.1 GNAT family N-acetyltransferase [Paenibacillus thiaminolyticus]WII37504.1 GNAT family protein [Paenibacillus thiaminolyticus]